MQKKKKYKQILSDIFADANIYDQRRQINKISSNIFRDTFVLKIENGFISQ